MLDIDANDATEPLTDGLLVLRYLFGFRGATLINGVVGPGCTRCLAEPIEDYLEEIELQLDIDDDGEAQPLTDGLLVLRYLFGFRGPSLITGAVDLANCDRCLADDIEDYLDGLDG